MNSYGSNALLVGHVTQRRCGLCPLHPILCDDLCLDCGTTGPPLFTGALVPTEEELAASRPPRPSLEPATFRTPRSDITYVPPLTNESDARSDDEGRAAPEAAPQEEPGGSRDAERDSVAAAGAERSERTAARAISKERPRKRSRVQPLPNAATPSRSAPQSKRPPGANDAPLTICARTWEPVNITAMEALASRRAAGFLQMPGCAVSLREAIFYFLQCCVEHERDANGHDVGALPVVWRESRCETEMGCKTRRYSGFAPFLALEKKKAKGTKRADEDEEEDKTDPLEGRWEARFRALLEKGVPACYLGRSLFSVSKKSLRHLARTGLQGLDIDQVNAHFQAQLQRHPRARSLGEYIRNRETMLQQIIRLLEQGERQKPEGRASALLPSEARDAAKDLFIILGYGGCERKWCEDHGVDVERLPAFAREFSREQQDLRKQDVADNRDLYAKARALGHPRPDVKVQATLNLSAEREALDQIEEAVEGCCALASYEHDGIYVWRPPWEERESLITTRVPGRPR